MNLARIENLNREIASTKKQIAESKKAGNFFVATIIEERLAMLRKSLRNATKDPSK